MRFLTLYLLLAGCSGHISNLCSGGACITPCGLTLRGSFETGKQHPDFDMGMLTRLEQLTIEHGLGSCTDFDGYAVWVREGNWDLYGNGEWRVGSAYCNELAPRIEISVVHPEVVIHELHHVQQRCMSDPPVDKGADSSHADWIRTGAFKRIDEASENFKKFMHSRGQ